MLASIQGLPHISVVDIIDVSLVALLIYELYKLVRGTNVMRIFWALVVIYGLYFVVSVLHMRLSSEILGEFVSVGLMLVIIVFQPEIRRFLLLIGTKTTQGGESTWRRLRFWRRSAAHDRAVNIEPYIQACLHMSQSKTGALIIFSRQNDVSDIVSTGERLDALVSSALIEQVFYKNTPLHDGAMIVKGNTILAARCILPVTSRVDVDPNLGLRHRSAIGVTEQSDVIAVVVSEETGAISYAVDGVIHHDVTPVHLRQYLEANLKKE